MSASLYGWFAYHVCYHSPTWSPGGNRIAYETEILNEGGGFENHIELMNILDKKVRTITYNCYEILASPDGKKVIVDNYNIYNKDFPGKIVSLFPENEFKKNERCSAMAWSPDGKKIAYYIYDVYDRYYKVKVIDVITKKISLIYEYPKYMDFDVKEVIFWDADNVCVMMPKDMTKKLDAGNIEFIKFDNNGLKTGVVRDYKKSDEESVPFRADFVLVKERFDTESESFSLAEKDIFGTITTLIPGNGLSPAWAPKGNVIAFMHYGVSEPDIWTVDLDSGRFVKITKDGGYFPIWSSDGLRIAYKKKEKTAEYYCTELKTGKTVLVKEEMKGQYPGIDANRDRAVSPDGKKTVFVREGTTKDYESYEWSELIMKDLKTGKETVVGERRTNF